MVTNFLKMFFRSIWKHKLYSFINIAGLAVGMSSSILILQYVFHEFNYDSFWKNSDNIYRVSHEQYQNGILQLQSAKTFQGVGEAMLNEFPEVTNQTKFMRDEVMCYTDGNETRLNNQNLYWVDTTFFDVFSMEFVYGSRENVFQNNYSSMISLSAAKKLFGNENPIGKWYKVNEGWSFCVTGVFKDVPENSHINMNFIVSSASLWYYIGNWDNEKGIMIPEEQRTTTRTSQYSDAQQWRYAGYYTYVLCKNNVNPMHIEAKLSSFADKYTKDLINDKGRVKLSLQNIKDIHLSSNLQFELGINGDNDLMITLMLTAFIIMIIAFANYVNLSIVKSMDRAKETALRKIVGADKNQLIKQHLLESFLTNFIAIIFAVFLVEIINMIFTSLAGKNLVYNDLMSGSFWLIIITYLLVGTLLSGIYPALVLSSSKPIDLFKKRLPFGFKNTSFRKILIGFQFTAAIILLTITFVIYEQMSFMQNHKTGVNIDHVLYMRSPYSMIKKPQRLERLQSFKSALNNINGVKKFATSSSIPGCENLWQINDVRKAGSAPDRKKTFSLLVMDEEFVQTLGLNIISGMNFLSNETRQHSVLLNEKAAQLLGYKKPADAINDLVQIGNYQFNVVGIISDYHHEYMKKAIQPTVFMYGFDWYLDVGYYSVKINSGNVTATVNDIKKAWNTMYPDEPFDYFFLEQTYQKQYEADRQFGIIFSSFSIISILLTSFGLFALTSYNAVKRTKEIGIRKSLGATIPNIFYLLNKEFIILLIISYAFALPISIYLANYWLLNYTYRINLGWTLLAIPLLMITLIIISAMSFQAIKAAKANPIISLKYE
jgi:putative ABC transport system permease protein